jgi:hypothetical protein
MIRALPRTAVALLVAGLLGASPLAAADPDQALHEFARAVGLRDVQGFTETVAALRSEGHLPSWYVSKREAERRGWRPGRDLCRIVARAAIGGDRFRDHQHVLPNSGRRWREADLDERCGDHRGTHRLLWSDDGLIYVTTDHYRTFIAVPAAGLQ